jgi:hypothetical protein
MQEKSLCRTWATLCVAVLLTAAHAGGQGAAGDNKGGQAAAPVPSPAAGTNWVAPAGTAVSIDRRTGRVSMALPIQPIDGSTEEAIRFEEWRLHPYAGSGPYPATREEPDSLPTHTIYRPADLAKTPKLPILLWANGGCRNTSVEFTRFLGEIASQGYLVIAVGRSNVPFMIINFNGGLGVIGSTKPYDGPAPLTVNDANILLKGLDWAVAENDRPGSPLQGKLDTSQVAAAGQSCGGPQAFRVARDPRIKTILSLNSGFPVKQAGAATSSADAWTADKLTVPAALFEGGPADLGYAGGEQTFAALPATLPALKVEMPLLGHTGAYPMPDIRWTKAVVAWLDWRLKGSASAMAMFAGPNCRMCSDTEVWIETRNIP